MGRQVVYHRVESASVFSPPRTGVDACLGRWVTCRRLSQGGEWGSLMTQGVDGAVELVAELDRLSASSAVAANAPRSSRIYRYLSDGMSGSNAEKFTQLIIGLIGRLGVWWSSEVYAALPIIVPWCIRDRTCRYDQGPESWGAPRSDGYLRDDNSIVKKLPLSLRISGPEESPYKGQKPWRGFTACHIWRDLPDGTSAGADPWLYSFVPNLVWLPTWLAPLSDQQGGQVQALLQRTSMALFGDVEIPEPISAYVTEAWKKLPAPDPGVSLGRGEIQRFEPAPAFFSRRLAYLDKIVRGCDDILEGRALERKLICTRYTKGLPLLNHEDLLHFRNQMDRYRRACSDAVLGGAAP